MYMNVRKRDLSVNAYNATLVEYLMLHYDFQQHRRLRFRGR